MKRFVQVVLAINIAIVALVDEIGTVFHVGPNARLIAAEPIFSRQYAAVALGYAVVLAFLIWPRFQREPVWLLVPATILTALWLDAVFELSAGTALVSENLPPTILRALFVACYVAGFLVLSRRAREQRIPATAAGALQ
jgi:hypothetical protein